MSVKRIEQDGAVGFQWEGDERVFKFEAGDEVEGLRAYQKAVAVGLASGAAGSMTDVERAVALDIGEAAGVRKDADTDSRFVAWYPDPETATKIKALMPEGNVAVEDLHMTLLFLGDPDHDGSGPWDDDLVAAAVKLWSSRRCPEDAEISGFGRFIGDGDTDVIVALLDGDCIDNMRRTLMDELGYACAAPYNSAVYNPTHGFVPHITLASVPAGTGTVPVRIAGADSDGDFDVTIGSVRYAVGNDHTADFPLGSKWMMGGAEAQPESPSSFYLSRAGDMLEELQKAGRVVSAGNMKKLDVIIQHAQDIKQSEMARRSTEEDDVNKDLDGDLTYYVEKAKDEWQYTFGPLYVPDRIDAHGEWTDGDTLQKALHNFVQSRFDAGDNSLSLQHGELGDHSVGRMVEFAALPFEHTVKMQTPDGEKEVTFPPGTTWVGAYWDDDAWPLVKANKLTGWSMGGKSVRMALAGPTEPMGYKGPDGYRKSKEEVDADIALMQKEREDAALALAQAAGERDMNERNSSLLGRALELFTAKEIAKSGEHGAKIMPDVHVHLPEQNVIINETPIEHDGVEEK